MTESTDGVADGVGAGLGAGLLAVLDGRTFASTSVTGHDLVAGSTLTVTFGDRRVSVNGGGNTLGAEAVLIGNTLRFGSSPVTTMLWPGEELAAQDEWLTTVFLAGVDVALDGRELTLSVDDVVITLEEPA